MAVAVNNQNMDGLGGSEGYTNSNVICQLTDPEGNPLGDAIYLPQNAGPPQLQQLVNTLLQNEERLPYAFYIADQELVVELGVYLQKNKVSVEKVLRIVYQPQAIFRIRPVNRCSATIAGHTEAVLSVAFSPDSRQLASGSGDTNVRFWDLNTQTPLFTCTGHKNWVLYIAWSADGNHLVSGSKTGELLLWDPKTGKQLGIPLKGHKKWITGISWEPVHLNAPCRRFVSSSKDGDARIWDIILRKSIVLAGHTLAVTCVKWGGDGRIYTGSQDCTIKVWESEQGKCIRTLKKHGHWVNSLALSTEYILRTGAFDHTGKTFSSPNEMKEAAIERYKKVRGPKNSVKRQLDTHYFPNGSGPVNPLYSSCAVVGNSGILLKTEYGEFIDSHEAVIRLNNARIQGYFRNVGSKTTLSFVNSNILHLCARREGCFCHPYGTNVAMIMYICQPIHFLDHLTCIKSNNTPLLITDSRFDVMCARLVKYYSMKRFVEETKKVPEEWVKYHDEKVFHYSSGMQAVMLAVGMCEKVSVFGFGKSIEAKHHYHTNQKAELDLHDYGAEYALYRDLVERPELVPFINDSGFKVPPIVFYH